MRFEEILVLLSAITGLICVMHFLYSRKQGLAGKVVKQNWIIDYSKSFFPVLLIVLALRSFLFEPFRIPTGSMKPTLVEGDFILVNKFTYGFRLPILGTTLIPVSKPKVGDIIVFRHPDGKDLIKRVVAVPGDHIRYVDKQLYINNKLVPTERVGETSDRGIKTEESKEHLANLVHRIYIYPQRIISYYPYQDIVVPEKSYFVMGDNRDNSEDSRFWGFVRDRDLLGKAFATWMSWDSEKPDVRWNRIGKSIYEYSS